MDSQPAHSGYQAEATDPNVIWSGTNVQEVRSKLPPSLLAAIEKFETVYNLNLHLPFAEARNERRINNTNSDTVIDFGKTKKLDLPEKFDLWVVPMLENWNDKQYLGTLNNRHVSALFSQGLVFGYISVPVNEGLKIRPEIHIIRKPDQIPPEKIGGLYDQVLQGSTKALLILGAINEAAVDTFCPEKWNKELHPCRLEMPVELAHQYQEESQFYRQAK